MGDGGWGMGIGDERKDKMARGGGRQDKTRQDKMGDKTREGTG